MPTETRRIVGPETTIPYRLYSSKNVKSYEELKSELLTDKNVRKDQRNLTEARLIFADIGCVTQAKGSAYVEMGNTKVIVAVYEPRETPKQTTYDGMGDLFCEVKFAPFSTVNRVQLQPGPEEKEMAAAMKRALEPVVLRHLFPNFQIDILAYVLENDGSSFACVLNAAGLALADAEIPLYDSIVALTTAVQGNLVFVDPTADEESLCLYNRNDDQENSSHGVVVKSILPGLDQVTELLLHGAIELDRLLEVIDLHKPIFDDIYKYMQSILVKKCKNNVKKQDHELMNQKDLELDIAVLMKGIKDDVQIS